MNDNERTLALDEKRMRQGQPSKVYRHEPARVFIEAAKKPLDLPEPITDPAQMREKIESYAYDESKVRFCASSRALKIAHLEAHSIDPSFGLLFRDIKLSELRAILGRGLEADDDLLSILDALTAERKLKISFAQIPDGPRGYSDIAFIAQVGCGVMEIARPSTVPALTCIIFHRDQPLTKADYETGNKAIIPSVAASSMRAKRDRHFQKIFGWKDLKLESALHHEDVLAKAEFRRNVAKLAGQIDKPDEGKE
jgi:hypothetical protein